MAIVDGEVLSRDGVKALGPTAIIELAQTNPLEGTHIKEYSELLAQSSHELGMMQKLPMGVQRKQLKKRISMLQMCEYVAKQGYACYTPPPHWTAGFLRRPSHNMKGGFNLYSRGLPPKVAEAYYKAKSLKFNGRSVFDMLTIHSPDTNAFYIVATKPPPRRIDPVLVGWVNAHWNLSGNGNYLGIMARDREAAGEPIPFLIAAWDLNADLAFNPLQIEAPH